MVVYAVYVVSSEGRLLVAEKFQSSKDFIPEIIPEGLSTALQAARSDPAMQTIEMKGLSYNIKSFGLYRVILVTPVLNTIEDIIQTLGLRFMKEHGEEMIFSAGDVDEKEFSPFRKTIHEIVNQETESNGEVILKPSKKFTTADIFNLSHQLQSIALAVASLGEGTLEDIAQESGKELEYTLKNVTALQEQGFLGKKEKSGKIIYFCSI